MAGIQVIVPVADTSRSSWAILLGDKAWQEMNYLRYNVHLIVKVLYIHHLTKSSCSRIWVCAWAPSHFMCLFIPLPTYTNIHPPSLYDHPENVRMWTEALAVSTGVQAARMNNFQRFEQACSLSEVLTLKFADDQLSTHNDSQVTVLAKTPR